MPPAEANLPPTIRLIFTRDYSPSSQLRSSTEALPLAVVVPIEGIRWMMNLQKNECGNGGLARANSQQLM